ncbi:MAG: helix-turn-helix domain-containing protein [Ignisphaera sp.]
MADPLEELSDIAAKIYIHLLVSRESKGVREISRELGIPVSTVHYNIKRLEEKGLVKRDNGGYAIAVVIPLSGFVVLGKKLIHKFLLYSIFFLGILIGEIIRVALFNIGLENSILTIIVSFTGFGLFLYEALKVYGRIMATSSQYG